MNLMEKNKAFEGRAKLGVAKKPYVEIPDLEEKVSGFFKLLGVVKGAREVFNLTESAAEFYRSIPFMEEAFKPYAVDVFYAAKNGYSLEGVPPKCLFILNKAIRKYNTPNNAISAISDQIISQYCAEGALGTDVTLKTVLQNIMGKAYKSLTLSKLAVLNNGVYEVYVSNVDRVLILPKEYEKYLNDLNDLRTVEYVKSVGVCIHGEPFRTLMRNGITTNEFDLRDCI